MRLGVEALETTVQAARAAAAAAMDKMIAVLKGRGVEDRDMQTSSFNISPRFEVVEEQRKLIGYQVSNQVTVKIRDLDAVDSIIDEVVAAGGDLTRFQGVSFSIENPKPLEEQARAAAGADLMDKAKQLAKLSGVELGTLVSISEFGGSPRIAEGELTTAARPEPTTSIAPGEVEVIVTLQATFAINVPMAVLDGRLIPNT
jgi:uncharacterized protein YggE